MITKQRNLAAIAAELFAEEVRKDEVERIEHPMTTEKAQALANQMDSAPEDFLRPLGVFSEVKKNIGIGRWGNGVHIFDIENGSLFTAYQGNNGVVVVYRATDLIRRFEEGEDITIDPNFLGEFLFGGGSMEVALGFYRADLLQEATLSSKEVENLFARLRAQDIEPEDYLV